MEDNQITKAECKSQLEELGVIYKKQGLAITKHICNATTEIQGKTYQVNVSERIGYGVQIKVEGNPKTCVITYGAMLNMAEAMGIFDEEQENNNG
ncbi:hypothetical protein E2R48_00735 [Histophilus somni]|uniref:Phage protein n=1 Tax=Histophilus somni TaxID=731 RepID=A0AAX2S5G4_HISSO|nr:hypothetical protein [Histophilus somni]TEW31419.1 hypothetical protein E2R48_00735 [Histophilus somni]THA97468.1 hypothetical protein E6A58_00735 [Histophilus somni]